MVHADICFLICIHHVYVPKYGRQIKCAPAAALNCGGHDPTHQKGAPLPLQFISTPIRITTHRK